jgi:hypothetical protein
MLIWSYHWQSKHPFASMLLWELKYNSPWYTLKYYYSYCFEKWNTCSKGGLPPFPSSHSTMGGYPYHKRRFPNLDERHHCWPNSHRYGVASIDNNNTCNDVGCSRKNTIVRWTSTKRWLHSPCYWNVWVSSFSFWLIFYRLCIGHYPMSSGVFINPTFSLTTLNNKWISLSWKIDSKPWWMSSLLTQLAQIWWREHQWQQHMQWWWLF